jgi:hypothetical protein
MAVKETGALRRKIWLSEGRNITTAVEIKKFVKTEL